MDRIPCDRCGLKIPDPPEDAAYEALLCNRCYEESTCSTCGESITQEDREYGYCSSCRIKIKEK